MCVCSECVKGLLYIYYIISLLSRARLAKATHIARKSRETLRFTLYYSYYLMTHSARSNWGIFFFFNLISSAPPPTVFYTNKALLKIKITIFFFFLQTRIISGVVAILCEAEVCVNKSPPDRREIRVTRHRVADNQKLRARARWEPKVGSFASISPLGPSTRWKALSLVASHHHHRHHPTRRAARILNGQLRVHSSLSRVYTMNYYLNNIVCCTAYTKFYFIFLSRKIELKFFFLWKIKK